MSKSSPKAACAPASKAPSAHLPDGEGIIIAHHGITVEVRFSSGERCMVRVKRRSGHVVGDAVLVKDEVLERLPRRTELRRRDAMGGVHLVGANLDVVGIVVSPAPPPPNGFIDQAIVAARAAGLEPFLVVNKCDLEVSADLVAALSAAYADSVEVFPLSASTAAGLDELRAFFAGGHRGAFVGTTGVGKSSLLNALCPEIDLQVGTLNEHTGGGRHTTTVSTLHSLAAGGELIDTPGFNDFGLVDISVQELSHYFPGFGQSPAENCRFRNCRHRTEPGCAVSALVAQGKLPADRYAAYLEILDEVEASEAQARSRGRKG
ncbi:ribosome small subunit-dependent GTPase A [Trichloromonas sp.]|uniref:ribosome small subunit-dependent GTPase A n=1 Tax=Trichloromonas sp. TaxID=3069249 RepID=UPI003D81B291